MSPDDAPTPRISNTWEGQAGLARELSEKLRGRELGLSTASSLLDTRRASMLRSLRNACDYYRGCFERWPLDQTIDLEQKARDLREWGLLMPTVIAVLEP